MFQTESLGRGDRRLTQYHHTSITMSDTPTKTQLNKLKVAELRGQLTELGLATNGIKADLVQRLFTHYQEQEAEAEQAVEESQEEKAPSPAAEPEDVVPDVEPAPPSESQSQTIETPTELEDKQAPTEVEDAVAPAEVEEAVIPAEVEEAVTPAEVEEAVTPAEVEESAIPAEVAESVVEPETVMEVEAVDEETPVAHPSLTVKVSAPVDHPAGPPPAEAGHSEEVDNSGEGAEDSMEYGQTNGDVERKDKSKKKNKKKKKKNRPEIWAREAQEAERRRKEEEERAEENEDVEVEYIQQELELDPLDPMYRTFSKIFANFKLVDPAEAKAMKEDEVSEDSCQMTEQSMMKC